MKDLHALCPSCGQAFNVRASCSCPERSEAKVRKNGDVGFQIDVTPRRVQPGFVYRDGELRRR